MADENIMSLIQKLFLEDNNNYFNSPQNLDNLNDKFVNLNDNLGANFNAKNINTSLTTENLCNNTKKTVLKQLNNCQQANQNNCLINSQQSHPTTISTSPSSVSINKISTPNTNFFNELTNNSFLNNLAIKENEVNDNFIFSKNYLLNGNQNQTQVKTNFDLMNNSKMNTNSNSFINENRNDSLQIIKDSFLPTISECSIKTLLTPVSNANIFNNYGLMNNANNILHNNSSIVSSPPNLLSNLSQTSNSSTLSFNPFADLMLGIDDNVKFNYGLNLANSKSNDQHKQTPLLSHQNSFSFDTNSSPDSFIYTEEDRFESQMRSLANEVNSTIQLYMNGLHMRREGLLQQLEHVKKIYVDVLRKKKIAMNGNKNFYKDNALLDQKNKQLEKFILPNITFTKPESSLYKAISTLGFLNTPAFGPFCTASGDGLDFTIPGVNSTFIIETRNCFNDELLVGRENVNIEIIALFNENNSEELSAGNSPDSQSSMKLINKSSTPTSKKQALLEYNSKSVIPHTFFDHSNGKYTITYNVPLLQNTPPELIVKINVNGLPINDSPIRVPVQIQKKQNWKRVTTFGTEGNTVGQLCRPWGVSIVKMPPQLLMNYQNNNITIANGTSVQNEATSEKTNSPTNPIQTGTFSANNLSVSSVDQHYLIGVADRSNNRIQLLDYNSKTQKINVINVFGSGPGTRPGMFDRPAGICINLGLGHIIVADKDNHRIQVFSLTGRYLFKFGERGSRIGQFCYPWDIDSCEHTHQIVVSDTRNRRIQLFTPYGQYINHVSLLLDSPRGVAFLPDKRLVVSDFNKHRILVFDKFTMNSNMNYKDNVPLNSTNDNIITSPKIIGFSEGSAWGEFLRPQGIAVSGNVIFCADSRNNRICVYNMYTQTFEYLSEDLDFNRPSDLAVIDENLLVIIDFGNNRLQILQR